MGQKFVNILSERQFDDREPILMSDNMDAVFDKMSENNDEARRILHSLWQYNPTHAINYLLKLDRLNIRGEQIVVAFKKFGIENICRMLDKEYVDLVTYINQECKFVRATYS